jgi:tetratricopeptide (TPR) repeat protein
MRKLNIFTSSVLLATTPSMLVYPQEILPRTTFYVQTVNDEEKRAESDYILSYDDMIRLLDEIESGELENRCTAKELEHIKQFVTFLAKEGVLPDDSEESLSLDADIRDLLNGEESVHEDVFSFVDPGEYQYMIVPTLLHKHGEVVLCKSWMGKQWKQVRKFVKKHKKAIIIGSAVVVAAAIIIVAVVVAAPAVAGYAAAGAAGVTGAAASSDYESDNLKPADNSPPTPSVPEGIPPLMPAMYETSALKTTIDDQITSLKENIVQKQFFPSTNPTPQDQVLSWEENGRAIGSLFAHDSLNHLQHEIPSSLRLAQEIHDINSNHTFFIPGRNPDTSIGHSEIDRKFSTDYTPLYTNPSGPTDINALSYQARGEKALACGYYNQAVQDLGTAIAINPTNPIPYLEKGIAHFALGQYDHSLEDYHQFASQTQTTHPFSVPDFSVGFAQGLPKGIYESGSGIFLVLADLVRHPIQTGEQILQAFTLLSNLARSGEWGALSEVLAPEVYQLVKEWDSLSSQQRGELAGYAFGKHGSDIILPAALAKAVSKGLKGAQELSQVCKGLKTAEQTLLLESVAGLENGAKIGDAIQASQKTLALGEDLGFSAGEMGSLKQAGNLESTIATTLEDIANNPALSESYKLFQKAESFLEPYGKRFLPESQIRDLIHQTGIRTFIKPVGIPENFRVRLSDGGAGMLYVHPEHTHTSIRIMPGKPHSPFPCQQKPYVTQMKDGKAFDKFGNKVDKNTPEAHIPIDEFVYRDK